MDGCYNNIEISASRLGSGITLLSESLGGMLSVQTIRIGSGLRIETKQILEELETSVFLYGENLLIHTERIGKGLIISPLRIGKGLIVICEIISDEDEYYLNVKPDVLWITPEMFSSAEFNIYSNVVWVIN